MGLKASKIVPLPIPIVLKRINECHVPDDRNTLLDYLEMLDINMCEEKDFEINTKQLRESNGMCVLMRILKRMVEDVDLVYVSLQLFETVKFNTPIVMDLIQYGGLDFLEKAKKLHAQDEFIAGGIPKLLKILIAIGAPASIVEINEESLHLQLCQKCQETIERLKQKNSDKKGAIVIPKSSERINRVLKFMDNFLVAQDVQVAALDAVISFARNADAPRATHETNLIPVVYLSLKMHPTCAEVVWRAAMAYSLVAAFSADIAFEVAKTGAHTILIDNYPAYKKLNNTLVQQQILWMLGALLGWAPSRIILNKQQQCMDFFKEVIEDFEVLKVQIANDPASRKKDFKDDKLYLVVVPLSIRSFIRETNGMLSKDAQRRAEVGILQLTCIQKKAKFKERRNFDERPKFGTVQSTIYVQGQEGLLTTGDDDEFGNEQRKIPEWEKKLNAMV